MFMILRKRTLIIILLIIAVIFAAILCNNYVEDKSENSSQDFSYEIGEVVAVDSDDITVNNSEILRLKQSRDRTRYDLISNLNEIVNNAAVDDDTRKKTAEKISNISNNILTENMCEELIIAKGYKDAIVYITENSVNVSVEIEKVNQEDIVKIRDIICEQTNNNNIKIVAVK